MSKSKVPVVAAWVAAGVGAVPGGASAQDKFPGRPIRMLVPFSPGSATDFIARQIGQKMSENRGQLGVKTVADLIKLAKSKPGKMNYGSAGVGSGTHMNGEEFKLAAGIQVVHVPYKRTPEAITNVISGSVQYFFAPITASVPMVKSGKVTGLAVTTRARSPVLPDLPTVAEAGLPGFEFNLWTGLLGPAKLPNDVKQTLAAEVARILALPDVKERMLTQGATPHTMAPKEFDAFLKTEVTRLAKVVKASGARAD